MTRFPFISAWLMQKQSAITVKALRAGQDAPPTGPVAQFLNMSELFFDLCRFAWIRGWLTLFTFHVSRFIPPYSRWHLYNP